MVVGLGVHCMGLEQLHNHRNEASVLESPRISDDLEANLSIYIEQYHDLNFQILGL